MAWGAPPLHALRVASLPLTLGELGVVVLDDCTQVRRPMAVRRVAAGHVTAQRARACRHTAGMGHTQAPTRPPGSAHQQPCRHHRRLTRTVVGQHLDHRRLLAAAADGQLEGAKAHKRGRHAAHDGARLVGGVAVVEHVAQHLVARAYAAQRTRGGHLWVVCAGGVCVCGDGGKGCAGASSGMVGRGCDTTCPCSRKARPCACTHTPAPCVLAGSCPPACMPRRSQPCHTPHSRAPAPTTTAPANARATQPPARPDAPRVPPWPRSR
jgi:hypothetical protein